MKLTDEELLSVLELRNAIKYSDTYGITATCKKVLAIIAHMKGEK